MRAFRKCPACGIQDVAECPGGSFKVSGICKCGAKMNIEIGSTPAWFKGPEAKASAQSLITKIKGLFK